MGTEPLVVRPRFVIPAEELHESVSTASGPGGQHVNKTASRISLRWNLKESEVPSDAQRTRLLDKLASRLTRKGELIVHVESARSQLANRRMARERLAGLIDEGLHVPRARRATRPTKGSKRRRVDAKKRRSATKRLRGRPPRDD